MPWGVREEEIDKAANALGLDAVENAFYNERGDLVLIVQGQHYVIPANQPVTTLPRGSRPPAKPSEAKPAESAPSADPAKPNSVRPPTGGSRPPLDPEPPSDTSVPSRDVGRVSIPATKPEHSSAGLAAPPAQRGSVTPGRLEDLTAIPGVGPVTAQKLHSLGLYTYDDLRERYDHLEELDVGPHQANKIRAWLDQRPA